VLIAAESTGRICCGAELNPAYVDMIIERWQALTGQRATHEDGRSFGDVRDERLGSAVSR
jgi:DNA modification methylase